MSRSPRGACGKLEQASAAMEAQSVCFTCDRPKDDATAASCRPWRHIRDEPYWAGLMNAAHSVQGCWAHGRYVSAGGRFCCSTAVVKVPHRPESLPYNL